MRLSLTNGLSLTSAGGGFSPSSLSPAAWYDPADLTTLFQDSAGTTPVTANNDPVGKILDKSGNGNHLIQAGASDRPLYKTSGGLHWLEFDGASDYLSIVSMTATDGSGHHCSAAAVYFDTITGTQIAVDMDIGGAGRLSQCLRHNGGTLESVAFNTAGSVFVDSAGSITATTPAVLSQLTADAAVEMFLNGTGNGSTAITGTMQSGSSVLTLGANSTISSLMDGRIYGVIHLARKWTAAEKINIEAYLATKAGL